MLKKVREEGFDKFYTIPTYSKKCIDKIHELFKNTNFDLIIEPSAGNGSFLIQLKKEFITTDIYGLDIQPEHESIIQQDFFTYNPPSSKKNILVIGNPPFGKISSTAVKFFNHASEWASVIAFIIPRTFRKASIQNKLNNHFHLIYDEDVPLKPCNFEPVMNVKCSFQIWKKSNTIRDLIHLPKSHIDWDFLQFGPKDENNQPTPPKNADFALRAYGGRIGDIEETNLEKLRPKSWHWIKANINKNELISRFKKLDYSNSLNTARQNSMGQSELISLYEEVF